jgi:hypothetical protein
MSSPNGAGIALHKKDQQINLYDEKHRAVHPQEAHERITLLPE